MTSSYSADEIRELIEALRGEDMNARFNAIGKIKTIARALGPARTKNELIPYISETIDNTEEAWVKIAEQMPQIIDEIGGIKEATVVLKLLKQICEIEDQTVQTAASIMFFAISCKATQDELVNQFYPILQSMCQDQWHPLRCAAAVIICHSFALYPEAYRKKLALELPSLANDSMTIVRKSLASALPQLIQTSKTPDQMELIENLLTTLSGDLSHSVLIEIPNSIADLPAEKKDVRVACIKKVFSSPRWQARAVLADSLNKVFKGITDCGAVVKSIASPGSIDASIEVRTSIARQLPFIFQSKAFTDAEFGKFVTSLSSDKNQAVRVAVASSIGNVVGAPPEIVDTTLTLLLEDSVNEVKMAALTSVAKTGIAVPVASKHIGKLVKFSNWRVKINIPSIIPEIAANTQEKYFNDNFLQIISSLLSNESADVRKNMVKFLPKVIDVYGDSWKVSTVVPMLEKLFNTIDYQVRQSVIESIFEANLVKECDSIIKNALADKVPNVRLVLARCAYEAKNTEITGKLASDPDCDVAFFAKKHE